jgi:hypothetical protein
LISNIEPLDVFLGPLKEEWLACFSGSKLCYDLLTRYAVNAQSTYNKRGRGEGWGEEEGGKHRPVIFIDGGNSFDAYGVAKYARMQGMDPTKCLNNILLSRAFTPYQLASLVVDEVPKAIEESGARVVLISEITALFSTDDEIDEREARIVFSKVKRSLLRITKEKKTISICSSVRSKKFLDEILRDLIHVFVRIEELQNKFRATVLEYPKQMLTNDEMIEEEDFNVKRSRRPVFGDHRDFNLISTTEDERIRRLAIPVIKYVTPS